MHLNAGYEIGVASTKAYTSMILSITMMALQLSEDSIGKREKRDQIIDELGGRGGKDMYSRYALHFLCSLLSLYPDLSSRAIFLAVFHLLTTPPPHRPASRQGAQHPDAGYDDASAS